MYKLYSYKVSELSDELYKAYYAMMSERKRARVDRFVFEDDKKRTVAGEMLARRSISEICGVSEDIIKILEAESGKPYLCDLPVFFSISHSYDTVVCVVGNCELGVDVEKIRAQKQKIIKRFCRAEEIEYISKCSNEKDMLYRLFEVWTAKEAYIKCCGGSVINMKSIAFDKCNAKSTVFDDEYMLSIVEKRKDQ